jgi:tetratricopeptide (TPR) repeat protein
MQFDINNNTIRLCAEGMALEGQGIEAKKLFQQAWDEASNDFEKFISAHYMARHQENVEGKLAWDETALQCALKVDDDNTRASYPSLYLNIAKCHEDLNDRDKAMRNYELALSYANLLPEDGYVNMIKRGIMDGMGRVK